MLVHIRNVLTAGQLAECRKTLALARWVDGKASAGHAAARIKNNREIDRNDPALEILGEMIVSALTATPHFVAAALPMRIVPPNFSRYEAGAAYGFHNDGAIFQLRVNSMPISVRADLAATLFLSSPDEYDGGELMIQDTFGLTRIKLPAGDLILYPASSVHQVTPVTRGMREVSFFWVQSLVRENDRRAVLEALDSGIRRFRAVAPQDAGVVQLDGVYHNLLRLWAET